MKKILLLLVLTISQSLFSKECFHLETTIENKVFNEVLIIDSNDNFSGSLTVPGVSTSPIEDVESIFRWAGVYYNFRVKIHENSQEYYVSYRILSFGDAEGTITGSIEKTNGMQGTVSGEAISCN